MKKRRFTERNIEARLEHHLNRWLEKQGGHVTTFDGAGVLTNNRGLVITLANGQSFQMTLVESTYDR